MQTICSLARFKFASGAEEKIVRTFQAPVNFMENFKRLCRIDDDKDAGLDEIIECMRLFLSSRFCFALWPMYGLFVAFSSICAISYTKRCIRTIVGFVE